MQALWQSGQVPEDPVDVPDEVPEAPVEPPAEAPEELPDALLSACAAPPWPPLPGHAGACAEELPAVPTSVPSPVWLAFALAVEAPLPATIEAPVIPSATAATAAAAFTPSPMARRRLGSYGTSIALAKRLQCMAR